VNLQNLLSLFEEEIEINGIEIIQKYTEILFHKMSANRQKKCFNDDRKNLILLEDTLVINIDWKQKVNIGMCERQPNANYRNQDLRSCFGFKLYTAILGELISVFLW
jgi:hypothetical protein